MKEADNEAFRPAWGFSPHVPEGAIFAATTVVAANTKHPFGVGVLPSVAQRVLYVNFPFAQQLAVYTYDSLGQLTFVRSVPNPGRAACWIAINKAGTRLYTSNAASGDITVYDIGTDAQTPRQIQLVNVTAVAGVAGLNGNPWNVELDSSNEFLYLLTPRNLGSTPAGQGNALHVFMVNGDGMLTEVPNSAVSLEVPNGVNPQGLAVL